MSGIDYGMGRTNIDRETGIRYGVISQNVVCQAWSDSAEPDYGKAHCPKCGNEACDSGDNGTDENPAPDRDDYDGRGEFACDSCKYRFDGDEAFGDEPCGWTLDDGEYQAQDCLDSDVMILKSPYFTRARFCSPCVPGACSIESPDESGARAYCFGPDWFDDSIEACPYPIWRVDTGELVYTPAPDVEA